MVYFAWRSVARVALKVNKRCDIEKRSKRGGRCRHPWRACTSSQREIKTRGGSAAAEVNDARAMKGGGGGGEHRMRDTARSLATVLRIKVQLTGETAEKKTYETGKMSSFCNKTVRARR